MSKTLKEWRELRGLTREELAQRIGVTADMVERWEEIGLDYEPGSRAGDYLVGKIMEVLEVEEGLRLEHIPSEPKPGDLVITPAAGAESLLEEILEHSEELHVRMAVPDGCGLSLKPPRDLTDEDQGAVEEHFKREAAYALSVSERMKNVVEMLGGDTGEWREGQTMRERLEEVGRELGEDLDRGAGE